MIGASDPVSVSVDVDADANPDVDADANADVDVNPLLADDVPSSEGEASADEDAGDNGEVNQSAASLDGYDGFGHSQEARACDRAIAGYFRRSMRISHGRFQLDGADATTCAPPCHGAVELLLVHLNVCG